MTSDLDDLYQEIILDHGKNPRNFHELPEANRSAAGHNPLCGDKLKVFVKMKDGVVEDVAFVGAGCAISTASASLMTSVVKGKTLEEVQKLFRGFREMVTADPTKGEESAIDEKLAALRGVCEFPTRVKCATLCWHTLAAALEDRQDPVTTE
jgi:nitrogen fixation NifU-like protein